MGERAGFFSSSGIELFWVLHTPDDAPRGPGLLLCHPFGEEKLWSHRVFVTFARLLAARGHPVLRFDFRGNGDSAGSFAEATLDAMVHDVEAAVTYLRGQTGCARVTLVGLRLGAVVAATAADRLSEIDRLVLWAPTVNGAQYARDLLRINLTTQMTAYRRVQRDRDELVSEMQAGRTVNVDGYDMSWAVYEQLSQANLAGVEPRFHGPCLIVHIDRGAAAQPAADLEAVARRYARAELVTVREEPFWKEIEAWYETAPRLFEATTAWLNRTV